MDVPDILMNGGEFKLQVHPEKTKIIYCKDTKRSESYQHESFVFAQFLRTN